MNDPFTLYALGIALILLSHPILIIIQLISVRCLLGMHKDMYAGMRSGMGFREGQRGVTGTTRPIHKCVRCGRIK